MGASAMMGLSIKNKAVALRLVTGLIFALSLLWQSAFAQTGRPVSGVIAATDAPIKISYINESGEAIGRVAGVGEPIYLNDEISTPDGASLQVLLRDQTVFSIGPNSTLIFDEFIFDPSSLDDVALTASVTKGTFKFISGKVSKLKPGAMKLKLPNATASIRGTSVVGRVTDTGASDLVLLSGAVQLEAQGTVSPVDLVVPGWGVSVADTGAASEPEPFSAEDIDEIIQEVEFSENKEAGEEQTTAEAEAATGEAQTDGEDENAAGETQTADAATEAEADPLIEAVREIGADGAEVTEEDIATIVELAGGDEEAVADAIVKVIIDEQIASGEITVGDLETLTIETLTELAPEGFAIEELGAAGLDVGTDIADVIATRLDSAITEFDANSFEAALGEFDAGAQFAFDDGGFTGFNSADIKLTETFKIEDVSRLIIQTTAPDIDAGEVELGFFDILYNAEEINTSFEQEFGKDFAFERAAFEQAAKEGEIPVGVNPLTGEITPEAGQTFNEVRGSLFATRESNTDETQDAPAVSVDAPSVEVKAPTIELKAPIFGTPVLERDTDAPVETAIVLEEFIEPEKAYDEPAFEPFTELEAAKEESGLALARIIEESARRSAETVIDPFAYYEAGKVIPTWLDLKSDGSVGHLQDVNELIQTSYAGSASFEDTLSVKDTNTGFRGIVSYQATLNYESANVTGRMALSSISMGTDNYYDSSGNSFTMNNFTTNLRATPLKKMDTDVNGNLLNTGDDENGNGRLDAGESIDDVRLNTVAMYNNTDSSAATSTLNAHLDMSVGSVAVEGAGLSGLVGEFDVIVEELGTGIVASETSSVRGEPN